ncbi:ATP-binding cassette sub-family A member 6 [Ceratobasidium sp. AG-Ba]|nr:ATP-binding cassette sub-family A member 6 [Ceratobasidium sp. AG-Ba]QRW12239.1 ATP-binding cassette sub-family A member 6 [Ceratobasidium sp. AG-Ba]
MPGDPNALCLILSAPATLKLLNWAFASNTQIPTTTGLLSRQSSPSLRISLFLILSPSASIRAYPSPGDASCKLTAGRCIAPRGFSGGSRKPTLGLISSLFPLAVQDFSRPVMLAYTETVRTIQSGTKPGCVVINQKLLTLRNPSVQWLVYGYRAINNKSIGFSLSTVPRIFSLSYENSNGHDRRKALNDLFRIDPKLYAEIVSTDSMDSPLIDLAVDEPTFNEADDSDNTILTAVEVAHQLLGARDAQEASRPTSVLENVENEDYNNSF